MAKVWIDGKEYEAEEGASIGSVLQLHAPEFALPCAGAGRCGKCKVQAQGNLSAMEETEREKLTEQEIQEGIRLACRTRIEGDCQINLPGKGKAVILQEMQVIWPDGEGESKTPLFQNIGASVDIGTTTMAACLYTKEGLKAQAGIENPQLRFGADVISRIEKSLAGGGEELAQAVREGIGELLLLMAQEAGCPVTGIDTLVITGNTSMLYLLMGRSPECLSHAPFEADWLGDAWVDAGSLGLPCPEAKVYLPPCIGSFVGADTATAILATGLCEKDSTRLLVDIGTNGEVALWKDGVLRCCSTAAGPAFEGTGLSMGMPGRVGAVAHVHLGENVGSESGCSAATPDGTSAVWDDSVAGAGGTSVVWDDSAATQDGTSVLRAEVIGDGAPEGICGSGVVDAVACLLESGRLDETGYLEEEEAQIAGPVMLTQQDIRMVQLAKSAICAGMKTMLHHADLTEEAVDELLVAGGFGSFLNLENAVKIGLLPSVPVERITVCRNAALAGASEILLDESAVARVKELAAKAQVMELATDAYFQDTYIEEMFFQGEDF